jgi:hypothetical protein
MPELRKILEAQPEQTAERVSPIEPTSADVLRWQVERDMAPVLTQKAVFALLNEVRRGTRLTRALAVLGAASFVVSLVTLAVVLHA